MAQYMKKEVHILDIARKELYNIPKNIQKKFGVLIYEIGKNGYLEYPEGKKLSGFDLFEMRIIDETMYRCIYCYVNNLVVILSFF